MEYNQDFLRIAKESETVEELASIIGSTPELIQSWTTTHSDFADEILRMTQKKFDQPEPEVIEETPPAPPIEEKKEEVKVEAPVPEVKECAACKNEPGKLVSTDEKGNCSVCGKFIAPPPHAGGRPPLYTNVEELQKIIEEYFDYCDNRTKKIWIDKTQTETLVADPAPYTMSGLARALGMDRKTLLNYSHKEQFFLTIKEAREAVHEDVETRLMDGKAQAGAIFNLKNNFGWKDEQHHDVTSDGKPIYGDRALDTVQNK